MDKKVKFHIESLEHMARHGLHGQKLEPIILYLINSLIFVNQQLRGLRREVLTLPRICLPSSKKCANLKSTKERAMAYQKKAGGKKKPKPVKK